MGISGINLKAKAVAVSSEYNAQVTSGDVLWVDKINAYSSDVVMGKNNFNDTAILMPYSNVYSASYDMDKKLNISNLNNGDIPINLGPGGYITVRLPVPVIDKVGYDIYVKEMGAKEGYMVFAGVDKNPEKPYTDYTNPGEGILWKNISCSGKSDDGDFPYESEVTNVGVQDKFYGSAYFDLGASCVGQISMAKYLKIVDDNSETAYKKDDFNNDKYYRVMLYGESSNSTSGADIGQIKVMNFVRLVTDE